MEFHWLLPPGAVKVNVHEATAFIPYPNGNTVGIGMIIRDSEGELIKISTGTLPSSSPLEIKLNAILHGLERAFEGNLKEIILKTDNYDVFCVIKNFPQGAPQDVEWIAKQIFIRLHDPRWVCSIFHVYSERNEVAIYLTKLGAERCNQLYTLSRPIGAVEELLSLDLGFGHLAPEYQDVKILAYEEDPVDFRPNYLLNPAVAHGGYAFHEDHFAIDNNTNEGPVVMPAHQALQEEYILGKGYINKYNF